MLETSAFLNSPTIEADMSNSTYIRRGGLTVLPPPWNCTGVNMHLFYLIADPAALTKLCNRTFNEPTAGDLEFVPASPMVLITFQHFSKVTSSDPRFTDHGAFSEEEATIWIFMRNAKDPDTGPANWTMAVPYIFTSHPLAVASGREAFGFPKEQSRIVISSDEPASLFEAWAYAIAQPMTGQMVQEELILRVERTPIPYVDELSPEVLLLIKAQMPAFSGHLISELVKDLSAQVFNTPIKLLFLKQFRSAADANRAAFTAVVQALWSKSYISAPQPLKAVYTLHTPTLHSHPIAADLGLSPLPTTTDRYPVFMAARLNMDFELGAAQVIWAPG